MQLPYKMGGIAVDAGEKLLNGENIDFDNPDAREILVEVELITIDNVEEARSELM